MRIPIFVLTASLAGNLILAALLLRAPAQSVQGDRPTQETGLAPLPILDAADPVTPMRGVTNVASSIVAKQSWEEVFTGDLRLLIDRLRAEGFPEREVRALVASAVAGRSNLLRLALRGERELVPYWRAPVYSVLDRELERELQRQMEPDYQILRELPGSEAALLDVPLPVAPPSRRLDHLPEEKQKLLQRIDRDYDELRRQVMAVAGTPGPESQEKLRLLAEERRRDVQAVLTPEEYAEHQLRTGPTADFLRARLDLFQPTEQEFRALHALHESALAGAVELPANATGSRSPQQVMTALRPQIEALLGPERFADLKQTQIESARRVNNLLVRLDLPLRTGGRIEELRGDIVQRADAVRGDPSLAPAERTARLGALQTEARQRIATTLGGERNLAAYEDIKGWIRDLSPAP